MMKRVHAEWQARLAPLLAAITALPPHVRGDYEAMCVMLGVCARAYARGSARTHIA